MSRTGVTIDAPYAEELDSRPIAIGEPNCNVSGGLYAAIGGAPAPESYLETNLLYSSSFEMHVPVNRLIESLDDKERFAAFGVISRLSFLSQDVAKLFPEELQHATEDAFLELSTSILWAFDSIHQANNVEPQTYQLRSGNEIDIRGFDFDQAVNTARQLVLAVTKIAGVMQSVEHGSTSVHRVNANGRHGLYRIGGSDGVLAEVRMLAQPSYDRTIEYGSSSGAEASIGFSIDAASDYISPYKKEQVSPFCIRIDNEDGTLSLDVGSILGPKGTLGKDVADLITIGDAARSSFLGAGQALNHSKKYYNHTKHGESSAFAQMLAPFAAQLENIWQAQRSATVADVALQASKVAA